MCVIFFKIIAYTFVQMVKSPKYLAIFKITCLIAEHLPKLMFVLKFCLHLCD